MLDYSDSRFGRFLLYLLVWHAEAKDWTHTDIGWNLTEHRS